MTLELWLILWSPSLIRLEFILPYYDWVLSFWQEFGRCNRVKWTIRSDKQQSVSSSSYWEVGKILQKHYLQLIKTHNKYCRLAIYDGCGVSWTILGTIIQQQTYIRASFYTPIFIFFKAIHQSPFGKTNSPSKLHFFMFLAFNNQILLYVCWAFQVFFLYIHTWMKKISQQEMESQERHRIRSLHKDQSDWDLRKSQRWF